MHLRLPPWASSENPNRWQSLIEKTRIALDTLHYTIEEDDPYTGHVSQVVGALIYSNPIRIAFQAIGETDDEVLISPDGYPLTDTSFDGESFSVDFMTTLEDDIEEYRRYLRDEP